MQPYTIENNQKNLSRYKRNLSYHLTRKKKDCNNVQSLIVRILSLVTAKRILVLATQ